MEDFLYKYLNLYNKLPLKFRQLIGILYRLIPKKLKYGSFYDKYLKRINEFKALTNINDINKLQQKILIREVNIAIDNITFYKRYKKVSNMGEFNNLPIIKKSDIISNYNLFTDNLQSSKGLKANTGGSSGNPLQFYLEKGVSRPKEKTHFDWYWQQFGYKSSDRLLMIRGMPLPQNRLFEYRTLDNVLNVSCYNINKENIKIIIREINRFSPLFIHAYPSSLKILTSLIAPYKSELKFSPKCVFLGSEFLYETERQFFSDFFNTRVINWYGHSERLIHGGNCPYSNKYHFYPWYGYMQLLDDNNNQIKEQGKEGRIIATGFDNHIMPFIRYDTGDRGVLSESRVCECGFIGTSLETISGRGQDIIYLSDGTSVSLTAFIFGQHLESFTKIREIQIIQKKIGEIELKIVKNDNYTDKDEEYTNKTLSKSVNNRINISFSYTDTLPKTERGKNIFFVSQLKDNNEYGE